MKNQPTPDLTGVETIRASLASVHNLQRSILDPTGTPLMPLSFRGLLEHRAMTATGGTNGDQGGAMVSGKAVAGIVPASAELPVVLRAGGTWLPISAGVGASGFGKLGGFTAAWVAENAPSPEASPAFEGRPLVAHRIALHCNVSMQLARQQPRLLDTVAGELLAAINRGIDAAALRGTGVDDQPQGVLLAPGVESIDAAEGAPTSDQLEQLEEAVRTNSPGTEDFAFVVSNRACRALRKAGLFDEDKRRISGFPVFVTGQMPDLDGVIAPKVGSIVFGRWSDLVLAIWDEIDLQPNPYSADVEGVLRLTAQAFADVEIVKPESFARLVNIGLGE